MPVPYDPMQAALQQGMPQQQGGLGMPPLPDNRMQVDPAMMAAWLGTQGDVMAIDQLEKQLEQANALRNQPMPEGREAGRLYVAANPLEHLGTGLQKFAAMRDAKRLQHGVRNPGYGPGVTRTPQPEWSQEGIDQKVKRVGESTRDVGLEYLKKRTP